MREFLNWLLHEKVKYFGGGFVAGIFPATFYILDVPAFPYPLSIWVFLLKFTGAVMIAFGSGIATALASDAYKSAKRSKFIAGLRNKIFNRKKLNDGRKDRNKAA